VEKNLSGRPINPTARIVCLLGINPARSRIFFIHNALKCLKKHLPATLCPGLVGQSFGPKSSFRQPNGGAPKQAKHLFSLYLPA
jgi:hypothetical protein